MGKIRRISKNLKNVVYICFFGAALSASTNFLLNFPVSADSSGNGSSVVDAGLSATSVSITATSNVAFDIVPTSSGTLGVGKGTVSVSTTASSGYKLYMSGPNIDANGKTALYLEGVSTSPNKLIGIPNSGSTPIIFPATNQWGYAVPSLSGAGFSDASNYEAAYTATQDSGSANASLSSTTWKGLDNNYQLIASTTSGGSGTSTVYYGVYADSTMMPGRYKNTVIFTAFTEGGKRVAIANSELNNGDDMEIIVEYQSSDYVPSASDITVRLYDSSNASADIGSCTNLSVVAGTGATTPLKLSCTLVKGANAEKGVDYDIDVAISIAGTSMNYTGSDIWQFALPTMQSLDTVAECQTMNIGGQMIAKDSRDGKKYYIAKLKDGNCWMTQNLDLDLAVEGSTMGTTKDGSFVAFTSSNTNISGDTWTIPSGSQAYATQTATGTVWDQHGRNNGANDTYEVRSYDPGMTCLANGTTNATCDPNILGSANHYHEGNYYNWPAATAGTGTYSLNTDGALAADSICPSGWHLAYGGSGTGANGGNTSGGFYYLLNSLGTSSDSPLLAMPYFFLRSGYYSSSSGALSSHTSDGLYWSSTASNAYSAYYLGFGTSYVGPGTGGGIKGGGGSVRCVAD